MSNALPLPLNMPPDWETRTGDLLCPLCAYNLRGLTEGRCPECGFAFTWQEILDAEKNRHLYLFEHGKGRNIKSFWQTYWRTCRPRMFWTDLNPAQPVNVWRMLVYWFIASVLLMAWPGILRMNAVYRLGVQNINLRAGYMYGGYGGVSKADLLKRLPVPTELGFWRQAFLPSGNRFYYTLVDRNQENAFGWAVIFVAWPWLTLISMLVFRLSMRKAKIRTVHLIRTAIYSTDFSFLFILSFGIIYLSDSTLAGGWIRLLAAILCSLVTTYRLTIAFTRYLRVHRPLETVIASQAISFLVVFVALVMFADFSRWV